MSREGDLMRKALKRHLLPALDRLGFTGKSSKFMRLLPEAQDLLAIQYHKYGGSFILEFGRRERGALSTGWGAVVPEEKLDVMYLPVALRGRLRSEWVADFPRNGWPDSVGMPGRVASEYLGEDACKYDDLAQRVAGLLPQVEAWLSTGEKGPNVRTFGPA